MTNNPSDRIIGRYEGVSKGPLLICIGGMHGNESAGIRALELMLKMLEVEPITNESFAYKGRFLALKGNLNAIQQGVRYIDQDLNRSWTAEIIKKVTNADPTQLQNEEAELKDIHQTIIDEIDTYQPTELIFLDLHTTTATGGIFTIPYEDEISINISKNLYAPVVLGLLEGIHGTFLHYFNSTHFPNHKIAAICFESGQHNDPLSINRAIAAITNCMRAIGSVRREDVSHRHNYMLQTYSQGLPPISHLLHKHSIHPEDKFEMKPGFKNFDFVKEGTLLACDQNGDIVCPYDCRILMPLYQKQGNDGFFLIKDVV